MIAPIVLLILSLAAGIWALIQPGASDGLLLAAPAALASLILLIRAWFARRRGRARHVIVDGSNVLHWQDNQPRLAPVAEVIARLTAQGLTPSVIFDANAGYKLGGAYMHDQALARALGLPAGRVMVADRGTPADPLILSAARDSGARIVTNDRYRDWLAEYPLAGEPGRLIRGGYRDGQLWLDI